MRIPRIVGKNTMVKTLQGEKPYVFFDNAASTPSLKAVFEKISWFLPYYSNVERGIGYKSFVSTEMFEKAREVVHSFVGATKDHTVIFVKNTTEAINKLARKLKYSMSDGRVLVTEMEHHSNLLPWLKNFSTEILPVGRNGRLNLNLLEDRLKNAKGAIKLVAVTGASNVTGFVNPIYEVADIVHKYGALISIDGAQLVPHRKIDMGDKLDFLSFSAHKFYAPFGSGALVGRKDFLSKGDPESVGGGTIKFVSLDEVVWTDLPEKEEAGTPGIIGAIALMAAIEEMEKWGMGNMEKRETQLHRELYDTLRSIDSIKILGGKRTEEDLPVISFVPERISPYILSSVLSFEYGIGVRTGCFCAQPYVKNLLSVTKEESDKIKNALMDGKFPAKGAVRVSLGFYNTEKEIAVLKKALKEAISRDRIDYHYDEHFKAFIPRNFRFKMPLV